MALLAKQKEFLLKLADLCDQYQAQFSYTSNDDGIHIEVDGVEVFADFLEEDVAYTLRAVAEQP